jgi:teichuronic acid biosynthesis glycosyltransferase TuaH
MTPRDQQRLVVIVSANPWDAPNRMMERHLAEHLAGWCTVIHCDPPMSPMSPLRHPAAIRQLAGRRLSEMRPGVWRLCPMGPPGPLRPGVDRLTSRLARRAIERAAAQVGGRLHSIVACNPLLDVFGVPGAYRRVFWAQDDFAAGAELFGQAAARLRAAELRQADAADLIIAANPDVAAHWTALGHDCRLIPYGCDAELFAASDAAPLPPDVHLEPPVAGFVGYLGDRIDIGLLEGVANSGHSLLLVGPRHPNFQIARLGRLLAMPNVQWVGGKRFEELPSYQRVIEVGLVPYADSAFNRGSFPLKTLEYLAAGRRAVATDLPAIRWLDTELVRIATGPRAFAQAVGAELTRPHDAGEGQRRRQFAAAHSWESRARQFAEVLNLDVRPPVVEMAG